MITLHIEHAISDLGTWRAAFFSGRGASLRERHGVRGYEVRRPIDDPEYLVIDLNFDDPGAAAGFLDELHRIWQTPTASPALVGAPRTTILESVEMNDGDGGDG